MIANFKATCTYHSSLQAIIIVMYGNNSLLSYSDFYTNQVMKIKGASISKGFEETAMEHNKNQKMQYNSGGSRNVHKRGPTD